MKFKEVEYKYWADVISLQDFKAFCEARDPLESNEVSGYDHFYENTRTASADDFFRHRVGPDTNQLTYKRIPKDGTVVAREEHNIDLDPKTTRDQVTGFCKEMGYRYNMPLFKTIFYYVYDSYVASYYICYDDDMRECGRFIELEAKEDYPWKSVEEAQGQLKVLEKLYKGLGLSAPLRVSRSLYDMYRKKL